MPTILSFLSGRQITNDSGVPQAGAKVYHYRATTTTNLTVWQDSDATVPHAQPVVCDAGGFVPLIYVDDTFNWKIVVTTATDVILPQYNFDNLQKAEPATPVATYSFAKFPWEQVSAAGSPVALTAADAGKAYEADTTGGNVEFDLPPAGDVSNGTGFIFKKTVAANAMIIDPSGGETIDNLAASLNILNVMETLGIYSNTAEWYTVLSHFNDSIAIQPFTGSDTYTPHARMRQCLVFSTGGGGGGGGADAAANGTESGGGGGAGATCIELFSAATIGVSQAVVIGAGGTAGALTGGNGGVGGNTTFGVLHTAGGGAGGIGVTTAGAGIGNGGAGGTATGGLINIPGGGGNSGASDNTTNIGFGGQGGSSFWGGSGVPPVRLAAGVTAGSNGSAYGSGATGAIAVDDITGAAGGVGAAGICVVIEFLG